MTNEEFENFSKNVDTVVEGLLKEGKVVSQRNIEAVKLTTLFFILKELRTISEINKSD